MGNSIFSIILSQHYGVKCQTHILLLPTFSLPTQIPFVDTNIRQILHTPELDSKSSGKVGMAGVQATMFTQFISAGVGTGAGSGCNAMSTTCQDHSPRSKFIHLLRTQGFLAFRNRGVKV